MNPLAREIDANHEAKHGTPAHKCEPIRNASLQLGRNQPCFCGSGKKFKWCCWQVRFAGAKSQELVPLIPVKVTEEEN